MGKACNIRVTMLHERNIKLPDLFKKGRSDDWIKKKCFIIMQMFIHL